MTCVRSLVEAAALVRGAAGRCDGRGVAVDLAEARRRLSAFKRDEDGPWWDVDEYEEPEAPAAVNDS